jgi:hypothetical protein
VYSCFLTLMLRPSRTVVENRSDLNFRPPPARHSARPSLQLAPDLRHPGLVARGEVGEPGRVLWLRRPGGLPLYLLDQRRPAAPPTRRFATVGLDPSWRPSQGAGLRPECERAHALGVAIKRFERRQCQEVDQNLLGIAARCAAVDDFDGEAGQACGRPDAVAGSGLLCCLIPGLRRTMVSRRQSRCLL